jgi:hypothetical protein
MSYDPALAGADLGMPLNLSGEGPMRPLPRRKLSRGMLTLLILLRIYVIAAIPIVAYAFIRALLTTHQ